MHDALRLCGKGEGWDVERELHTPGGERLRDTTKEWRIPVTVAKLDVLEAFEFLNPKP